ncbi:uncharacterized protein LOC110734580 [Chenopodium quinoa]|uniref:uncharacterized protein LOC110734580 n=1 Tax=Chenopodium quinoa TaxID=63459 RepID=UPI000B79593C|nr:uncharacterized protein LOC110734580 [Chenopodium quinoa]
MNTVKCLITTAASKGWDLFQLDVNNAFLHGYLKEEVYMKVPEDLIILSKNDYSLFIKRRNDLICVAAVYVDDIILTGTNFEAMECLKTELHNLFSIKDLGKFNYFLGIEVVYSDAGILLSQKKFTRELIHDCCLPLKNRVVTPLPLGLKLQQQQPYTSHLQALIHTLSYVAQTEGQGILLKALPEISLHAFSDSDWASCADTRKSITGYVLLLGKSPIAWKSKKQSLVSKSSVEAEY